MKYGWLMLLLVSLSVGCNDGHEQPEPLEAESYINVHTNVVTKAGPAGTEERAMLLLWNETTFHDQWIKKSGIAVPNAVIQLDNDIDYYTHESGIVFNTKQKYPEGGATVHITGYYPATLIPDVVDGTTDYSTLTVPEPYRDGTVDFMTCDGCVSHSASSNDPFTNEDKELNFRHLTARIVFLGERDPSMSNVVGVSNVGVTVYNQGDVDKQFHVPVTFKRFVSDATENEKDKSTYRIEQTQPAPDELSITYPGIINMGELRELGACYIVSPDLNYTDDSQQNYINPFGDYTYTFTGVPKLRIDVSANLYSIAGGQTASTTETWRQITVDESMWEGLKTGDKFVPGYEYQVILHFNRTGVTVRGEAVPWTDGGIHVHPVQPSTNP